MLVIEILLIVSTESILLLSFSDKFSSHLEESYNLSLSLSLSFKISITHVIEILRTLVTSNGTI